MRAVPPHWTRLLPFLAALAALGGCYGQLEAPTGAAPVTAESTPERAVAPSVAGTGASGGALADLGPILDKLQTLVSAPQDRPGHDGWRTGELQKLTELTAQLCAAGGPPCREALARIVAAQLPGDELLPVLGTFLGVLRPHAEDGFTTLGLHLLTDPSGETRDIAFRMAVASGVTRRGDQDAEARRASLVPQSPEPGQPSVVLVEIKAICNEVDAQVKGPDALGRIDLLLQPDCFGAPEPEPGADGLPRAVRGVWSLRIDALPDAGVSIWIGGADKPLLAYRPVVVATPK